MEGIFRARAVEGQFGYTNGGKEQVAVTFLLEGGQRLTWYGYFTEKTEERTFESLRYCGWEGTDLSDLTGIDRNEVELVVEEEEYDGKVKSKVQWVNRPSSPVMARPMDKAQVKSFAERMKGKLLAYDRSKGVTHGPPPRQQQMSMPPPHGDSDKPPF